MSQLRRSHRGDVETRARPARHKHASRCLLETRLAATRAELGGWSLGVRRVRGNPAGKHWNVWRQIRRPYHAPSGAEHPSLTHINTQSARHTANNSLTSALSTQPPRWLTRTRGDLTDTLPYCRHASCSVWPEGLSVFTLVSACATVGRCHILTD